MPTHRARRGSRRHRSRPRDRRTEQHVHQSNADERISPEGQNRRRREVSAENPSLRPRRVHLKTYHGHPRRGRRNNAPNHLSNAKETSRARRPYRGLRQSRRPG